MNHAKEITPAELQQIRSDQSVLSRTFPGRTIPVEALEDALDQLQTCSLAILGLSTRYPDDKEIPSVQATMDKGISLIKAALRSS